MKNYIYLLAVVVMMFFVSCDNLKDAIDVGFKTEIKAKIPVTSQKALTIDLKSVEIANDVYSFIGSGNFSLTEITELKNYINNIRSIVAEDGSVVSFPGAVDGNKVLTLALKYGIQITSGEEPEMITTFDYSGELLANNGVIEYFDNNWAPILIDALDANRDKVFVLKIEGTANYNVNTSVKIKVPLKVTASPL